MKTILHCDLNNFFASVECKNKPWLRNMPIAVCGREDERKGIVLAKNDIAKKFGVKTGDTRWEAKSKCKNIIFVPSHYNEYKKYSKLVYDIYTRFTDKIEPFGIDECWLDVTDSIKIFGSGEEIAYKIKETVKEELGLKISVGVSFNKIFAKLGSDMKKPDAVTSITKENYKEKVWNLDVGEMIGIGNATKSKLKNSGITTIGMLAETNELYLKKLLGKIGPELKAAARGNDASQVQYQNFKRDIKSIGNGTTCIRDLISEDEVWRVILSLSCEVCRRMRAENLSACGIQVIIKSSDFETNEYQNSLTETVCTSEKVAYEAFMLFKTNYNWTKPVRAITVRCINLIQNQQYIQQNLFSDTISLEKKKKIEAISDKLAERYGDDIIQPLSLKIPLNIPDKTNRPGFFH